MIKRASMLRFVAIGAMVCVPAWAGAMRYEGPANTFAHRTDLSAFQTDTLKFTIGNVFGSSSEGRLFRDRHEPAGLKDYDSWKTPSRAARYSPPEEGHSPYHVDPKHELGVVFTGPVSYNVAWNRPGSFDNFGGGTGKFPSKTFFIFPHDGEHGRPTGTAKTGHDPVRLPEGMPAELPLLLSGFAFLLLGQKRGWLQHQVGA